MASKVWSNPAFTGVFENTENPDDSMLLTIRCGSSELHVRKFQLNVNSEVLRRRLCTNRKDGKREFTLVENDENAVAAMMAYLSDGHYDKRWPKDRHIPAPIFHLRVLSIAVTYKVSGLGNLASDKFRSWYEGDFWKTAEFAETIKYIYSDVSCGLIREPALRTRFQEFVLDAAKQHLAELVAPHSDYNAFHQLLISRPCITYRLLQETVVPSAIVKRRAMPSTGNRVALNVRGHEHTQVQTQPATPTQPSSAQQLAPALRLAAAPPTTAQGLPSAAAVVQGQSRKREREGSPYPIGENKRPAGTCTTCEARFYVLPWSRDNDICTSQCRTCADQLELRI